MTTFSLEQFDSALEELQQNEPENGDIVTARSIVGLVANFARSHNLSTKDQKALENFGEQVVLNTDVAIGGELSAEAFRDLCVEAKVPSESIAMTARELARAAAGGAPKDIVFRGNQSSPKLMTMESITGSQAANFLRADAKVSQEAFGQYIDSVQVDNRVTMSVALMRPFRSIIDQLLPRITGSTDIVTIKVAEAEFYDTAVVSSAGGNKSEVRNDITKRIPLVEAFKRPSYVSTAPKKFIPNPDMDTKTPKALLTGTTDVLVLDNKINLFDLGQDPARFQFNVVNNTDLIAPGGKVATLVYQVTDGTTTELFEQPVSWQQYANYVQQSNAWDSGEVYARMPVTFTLASGQLTRGASAGVAGAATALVTFADAKVALSGTFNSGLNLKYADIDGSGGVKAELVPLAGKDASTVSDATKTAFAKLKVTLVGFTTEQYYDEENFRKSSQAVRSNYSEKQFQVPMGKNFFAEYQLSQATDENTVNAVTSGVSLGNTDRGLTIVTNRLNDMAAAIQFEKQNPEGIGIVPVRMQSLAGSLVIPTVITDEIDYSDAGTLTMRESERLTEIHGRARNRLNAITSRLHADSMYLTNMAGNEQPHYTVLVYRTEADMVFGIPDYHTALQDGGQNAKGQDTYDLTLPNGTILHVVKTDIIDYKGKVIALPVRLADRTHVTSFGRIQDCGIYSATYTPVDMGAAWRRTVVNSREIVFPTNPCGIILTISGLDKQLGTENLGY